MQTKTKALSADELMKEIWKAPQHEPGPVADLIIATPITEQHDELQWEWDLKFTPLCRVDVALHIREQKKLHP